MYLYAYRRFGSIAEVATTAAGAPNTGVVHRLYISQSEILISLHVVCRLQQSLATAAKLTCVELVSV